MRTYPEDIKAAADESGGEPLCMNWPPSRGPEPAWMAREVMYRFPEPTVAESPKVEEEPEGLPHYRTWAFVTDLLEAGPKLSDKLVLAAKFVSAETEQQRHDAAVSAKPFAGREDWTPEFRDHAKTIKYLDIYHKGIDSADSELVTVINYPLATPATVRVRPFRTTMKYDDDTVRVRHHMTVGWLLWSLARAYELIYAEHEKYGIWGHSIRDLCFETLVIDDRDAAARRAYVGVGS